MEQSNRLKEYDLLVAGECYVEFHCEGDIAFSSSYNKDIGGADTVVAATTARLGASVVMVSAIAHDPFHSMIRDRLAAQGINIDYVITTEGYNGIYFTSSRYPDQREYLFHRPGTAALAINPSMIYEDLIEKCKIVYASSELQSVSKSARHTVFKIFQLAHCNNVMVAYEPNLRLQRWSLEDAKESLWSVLPLVDVIFPSAPYETKALFGYERPVDVIGFLWDRGVSIVVVKTGKYGCVIGYDGKIKEITPQENEVVKDVTLIGSAFCGGFLYGIAKGYDPFAAAAFANSVAIFKGVKGGGIDSLPVAGDLVICE